MKKLIFKSSFYTLIFAGLLTFSTTTSAQSGTIKGNNVKTAKVPSPEKVEKEAKKIEAKAQKETKIKQSKNAQDVTNSEAQKAKMKAKSEAKRAQDQANGAKKEAGTMKPQTKMPKDAEDIRGAKGAKEKSNNGNHYGQNKGDLKGKEYGQARAEANRKSGAKKKEVAQSVVKGQSTAKSAQDRIKKAKTDLDEQRKAGKISEAEYNANKNKIIKAEKKLQELEEEVQRGKSKLKGQ